MVIAIHINLMASGDVDDLSPRLLLTEQAGAPGTGMIMK
jgi:hypothetical protein